MTVRELRKALADVPGEMNVEIMTDEYGGYPITDIHPISPEELAMMDREEGADDEIGVLFLVNA